VGWSGGAGRGVCDDSGVVERWDRLVTHTTFTLTMQTGGFGGQDQSRSAQALYLRWRESNVTRTLGDCNNWRHSFWFTVVKYGYAHIHLSILNTLHRRCYGTMLSVYQSSEPHRTHTAQCGARVHETAEERFVVCRATANAMCAACIKHCTVRDVTETFHISECPHWHNNIH